MSKKKILKRKSKAELKSLKSEVKSNKRRLKFYKKHNKLIEIKDLEKFLINEKTLKSKKKEYKNKYPSKTKKISKLTAKQLLSQNFNKLLLQDEDLGRYVHAKSKYSSTKHTLKQSKRVGKFVINKSIKLSNGIYGISNRAYNLSKGNGFKRTPKEFSASSKLKARIKENRRVKLIRNYKRNISKYSRPFTKPIFSLTRNVLSNPFKLKGLLSLILIMAIFGLFMSSLSPANMNEKNLNETWKYFTKLDREKSNSKVSYYSDIEEYVYYLNYRYDDTIRDIHFNEENIFSKKNNGDISKFKKQSIPDTNKGKKYLEEMWDFLNKDENNLKTISDLINSDKDKFNLNEKQKKEYQEFVKISNEVGKFPFTQELNNFLYEKSDSNYKLPLKILNRYGFIEKNKFYDKTTFVATANQYIYASFTGKVTVEDSNVTIEQGRKKITFYNLKNIRVTTGSQAIRNESIGQISEDKIEVKYEKLIDNKWQDVNIGFYLPSVKYIEKTEVIKNFELDGDKRSRINKFVEIVRSFIPGATNEGLAAVLGNFDVESNINPKRAEGDYLPAPIGVVDDSSWDSPEWLDIGGVQIYNGRYPNIIRRGLGLGQWTDTMDGAVRHTLLRNFANEKGKKWYDLELQVDFIINGDSPYYRQHFYDIVTSTEDVSVLTKKFLNNWEGNPSDKIDNRIELANSYLKYLSRSVSGQPLDEMENVIITSPFGAVRDLFLQDGSVHSDVHNGVDLVYNDGRVDAPIYSVDEGEVVFAMADSAGGLGVIVKHSHYYSYYWHLSKIEVTEGEYIEAGAYLGTMGTTGLSTGVHLHLGFSHGLWEGYYDPVPYLKFN